MGVLIPFVVAPVAAALIFGNLFGDRYGLVNQAIQAVGLEPIRWHVDRLASHVAIATMVNWRWTGYNALDLPGGHAGDPARPATRRRRIDGASKVRQFFSVTLPMLRPTVIFVVITSTIGGLQIFAEPRLFDGAGLGGADRQYQTITMYLWELGWRVRNLGTASAVAWLLFAMIVVFALVNLLLSRRIAHAGGSPMTRLLTAAANPRAPRRAPLARGGVNRRPGFLTYGVLLAVCWAPPSRSTGRS